MGNPLDQALAGLLSEKKITGKNIAGYALGALPEFPGQEALMGATGIKRRRRSLATSPPPAGIY
jgi:hypothetical protein